jgi:hypothetical protein
MQSGAQQWATCSFEELALVEPNSQSIVMESVDWLRRLKYLRPADIDKKPGVFCIDPRILAFDPTERILPAIENVLGADSEHSPDFRSVNWHGTHYSFTATQAECVKVLWGAAEKRTFDVGDATVLEASDSQSGRLPLVFRDHPAWGTMIVEGATRGTHRLAVQPE